MNRLWVQISLVFLLVILSMVSVPALYTTFSRLSDPLETISELAKAGETKAIVAIIEQRQRTIVRAITGILVTGGSVGVLVGIFFSRTLTRPLDGLKDAADRIQKKDFSVRVPEKGSIELQAVTHSFNTMATQLEKAEELRRNLLSDVAHELRHPLHIINGNIEAMMDGVFPMDAEGLARIQNQSGLLTRLIDDLHELAQAEAQQIVLDKRPVHIGALIDQSIVSFQSEAEAKMITLELALLGKLPELNIDPQRIKQVLFNLLSNALRYTPENGKIQVSTEHINDHVSVRIKDNGVGIDPAELPHVFDRFYRSDKARNREKSGSGLGLAIVKALIEAHGGSVSVLSEGNGKGCLFCFNLHVD